MISKSIIIIKNNKNWLILNIVFLLIVGVFYFVHGITPIKHYYVEKSQNEYDFFMPIYDGVVLIQPFDCNAEGIDTLELPISASDWNYDGDFSVSIANDNQTYVQTWTIPKGDLSERTGWISLSLNAELKKGDAYNIVIQAPNLEKTNAIEIRMTGAQDSIIKENSISFRDCVYASSLDGYAAIALSNAYPNIFVIISIILLFILINICWIYRKDKIEKHAMAIIGIMGVVVLLMVSPGAVNDDDYHYYSSLMLSNIIMGKNNVTEIEGEYRYQLDNDKNTNENYCLLIDEGFKIDKIDTSKEAIVVGERANGGSSLNSLLYPVSHLIPAIGITIGRILSLNFIQTYVLARLTVLIAYLIICRSVLKLLPYKKELAIIVMINPMLLQQVTSFSYDAIIIMLSMLYMAYIINIASTNMLIGWIDVLKLVLLISLFGPLKAVYYVHVILFFIITNECYRNTKDRIIKTGAYLFLVVLINRIIIKIFTLVTIGTTIYTNTSTNTISANNSIDIVQTLKQYYTVADVIKNPIESMRMMLFTIETNFVSYVEAMFGSQMAVTSKIPDYLIVSMIVITVIAVSIKAEDTAACMSNWARIVIIVMVVAEVGLILCAGFIMTDYGESIIGGIQGRYFLPCLMPLLIVTYKKANNTRITGNALVTLISIVYIGYVFNIKVL